MTTETTTTTKKTKTTKRRKNKEGELVWNVKLRTWLPLKLPESIKTWNSFLFKHVHIKTRLLNFKLMFLHVRQIENFLSAYKERPKFSFSRTRNISLLLFNHPLFRVTYRINHAGNRVLDRPVFWYNEIYLSIFSIWFVNSKQILNFRK